MGKGIKFLLDQLEHSENLIGEYDRQEKNLQSTMDVIIDSLSGNDKNEVINIKAMARRAVERAKKGDGSHVKITENIAKKYRNIQSKREEEERAKKTRQNGSKS